MKHQGPLHGIRIVEIEGMGGAPFGAMLLADLGAEIIRIERPQDQAVSGTDPGLVMGRGRAATISLDLKSEAGLAALHDLLDHADVATEAFRPGVAERLGFGPEQVCERNPRLVYARLTGWGREGSLARTAGHDINFIGMSGLLGAIGRSSLPPAPPLAIGGDMGGGGLFLALGIVSALFERERSGKGQVVDAAMVDGSALLASAFWAYFGKGEWTTSREANLTDGGAPFYDTYRCQDGNFVAVGALEPKFFRNLCGLVGVHYAPERQERTHWPALRKELTERFLTRPRDEWCALAEGVDACLSPVLDFSSAPLHPQNAEREVFLELDGVTQPNASPRFSRTPSEARTSRGESPAALLGRWGVLTETIATATASC
jgi:alpha-methylacyl-CoA racemase